MRVEDALVQLRDVLDNGASASSNESMEAIYTLYQEVRNRQEQPPSLEERVDELEKQMVTYTELLNCTRRTVSELRQGLNWDV